MTIRHGLLALLERGPQYGYQLHADFEASTGSAWPLNIGQVYATLARLQRDDLVRETGEAGRLGKVTYAITDLGRQELARWFDSAVDPGERPRDELAVKVALAVTTPGIDVRRVLQAQRTATLRHLRTLTRLKAAHDDADTAWLLVLESMVFRAEAEVRWLDHSEGVLADRPTPARRPHAPVAEPTAAAGQAAEPTR